MEGAAGSMRLARGQRIGRSAHFPIATGPAPVHPKEWLALHAAARRAHPRAAAGAAFRPRAACAPPASLRDGAGRRGQPAVEPCHEPQQQAVPANASAGSSPVNAGKSAWCCPCPAASASNPPCKSPPANEWSGASSTCACEALEGCLAGATMGPRMGQSSLRRRTVGPSSCSSTYFAHVGRVARERR